MIIVFTADHGEEFKEHGQLGHATTLFEEQVRIPLDHCRASSAFPPGTRRQDLVSLIDIGPTLLELAGSDLFAQGAGQARSSRLAPAMRWSSASPYVTASRRVWRGAVSTS